MIFRNWVVENFPFLEDDFDALTDYELFCKMMEYVKQFAKDNEDFNKRLTDLENYINNLDLQDEVNKKLDEMAESGELTDIIAQYLQLAGVLAFNTLNDLINATNIVEGSICKTLGTATYNDGKGYFYKIRTITSDDTIDNLNIIALNISNTLIAERLFNLLIDKCNPIYYGADPTGTIDSSTAIQNCIDANTNKEIVFTCGTYKIETPIEISYNNSHGGINFNNSVIIDETESDYAFGIGTKDHVLTNLNYEMNDNKFYNITNLKMKTNSTYAILIDRGFVNARFDNIDIVTEKNGIQIGKLYDGYDNPPSDVQLTNFVLTCKDMTQNYIGINVVGTDNKFNDGRIYGYKVGINGNENLIYVQNIHFLAYNFGENNLNNDYICIKDPSILYADMCFCDSYPCFVSVGNTYGSILVTNLYIYSWHNHFTEAAIFDFSRITAGCVPEINYKNIVFDKSNYPTNSRLIKLSNINDVNSNILNGFSSEGCARIRGVNEFQGMFRELALSKKGVFTNNYIQNSQENWIPLGFFNIVNNGISFVNIYDDTLGLITFKISVTNGTITATKTSQATSGNNPAIGLKLWDTNVYMICYAKDKTNLSTLTNINCGIELVKNSNSYILPIALDSYNTAITSETSVDIISN